MRCSHAGPSRLLVVVPRLMSAEYDHVIDVPHVSYDEWVAFHNEVAFDLWGYEVEKQIFKLVALDGTSEHLDRRGTLTSKINPIPIFLRPIVGHEPMTFECHAKWGVHRNDKQRPNISRTIVLSPRGLVGKLIVDGIQWAEPLPSGGVRVHSNLVVTVRVGVHIVDKTAAFLCLKRAESNLNALPDQVARYLEHRKSAVGASVVRRLGTWSAALVKSTAWTALDTAAAEAATAAAAAGALEGIVGAEEEVATPGATRNLQQRGTTFWLREHTGLLPAPPSQTPPPASASTASSASSASVSRYGAQEPPPLGSTPSTASTEEEEEEEEQLQQMGAAARARFLRKPEPVVPPLTEGTAGVLAAAPAATGQVHVILEPKSSPDFVAPRNRPVVPSAAAGSPVTGARSAELPSLPARLWTENARASTEVAGPDDNEPRGQEQLKSRSEPAGLDESKGQEQLKSRSELAELKELEKLGASVEEWRRTQRAAAARARFLRKPEPVVPPLTEGTAGVLAAAPAATGQVHVILEPKSSPDFVAPRNRPVVPSAAAGSPVTGARSAELPSLPARLWTENARASTEVAGPDDNEPRGQEQLKSRSEPAGLDESKGQEQLKSRSELAELKELEKLGASVEEWRRTQRAAAARARFLRKPEPIVPPLTEGNAGVLATAHVVEVAESPHVITPPPSTLGRALSLPKRVAQYGNSGRRSAALKASWAAQRKTAPNTAPIGPLSKPSVPVLATAPLPEPVPASVPGDWGGNLIDLEDWSQLKRAVPGVEDEERFKPLRSLQEIGSQVRDFTDRNVKQLKVPEHWENFTKGLQEHVVRRPKENLEELGHNLAEGTSEAGRRWDELRDNVARGIAEHVGEPVQEFSLNLAKGVDEHVAEPVREFSHSLARGVDEHIAKPVREIGPNFAKGTSEVGRRFDELRDNVARGIAEHVGEPVQEFSLNLAKGVDEHVAEPVREFSHSLARGVDERVAEPVRKVGKDLAKGVDERVAEPVRQFVKKLTKDEVPYDL